MSDIDSMRKGDIIIGIDARSYQVEEVDFDEAVAHDLDRPLRTKRFKADRLFCVDHDDGLWQETIN